ncbi:hypothetical protein [Sphingobium aromaticiconvertens]|uniref:hypothetical protein n=1 Tax=Sphingobium aromaticiconvertens TaxID=365341 RepID=UPI003018F80A
MRLGDRVEARAARWRARIVEAARELGVAAVVEGDAVRLSGRDIQQRWMDEARLRDVGRDGP